MYVTSLKFENVLDKFYSQDKYELMLLFVSSFDNEERIILKGIVDNARRIDRIIGDGICFFYFINGVYDSMNEKLSRWVRNVSDFTPLYGEGVGITMETADDICLHFGILRSYLPAFILINKNKKTEPQILSIRDYHDFERFLTPLNILHSYLEDQKNIISQYNKERQKKVVLPIEVNRRNELRESWNVALQRLERKRAKELDLGMDKKVCERDLEIQKIKRKLEENPKLVVQGEDQNVPYPQDELNLIRKRAIERLDISLNSHDGESLIDLIQVSRNYSEAVLKIWDLVRTQGVRISEILQRIRYEIHERGYDVSISCKSQDYARAHELYDFLIDNGYRPFLADNSIKEVGIDQYTAVIGEVINVCQNMIVFATDVSYMNTAYVEAEWHTFVNDINTGYKPNAKIVNILSPEIDIHQLPTWLRDKQCFTTEDYQESLLSFLKDDGRVTEMTYNSEDKPSAIQVEKPIKCSKKEEIQQQFVQFVPCPQGVWVYYNKTRLREKCSIGRRVIDAVFGGLAKLLCGGLNMFAGSEGSSNLIDEVYSSIFAPTGVERDSHMLVQVYLHLFEETETVQMRAQESQKDAERRDYIPLQCKLKRGDEVDVTLSIRGETLLMSEKRRISWFGHFTKCSFEYFVPQDINVNTLSCSVLLTVKRIPVGEMRFVTKIGKTKNPLNPEIVARKFNKVFISYSHMDESKVRFLHEGLEIGRVPHFFDRHYLKAGDVFPKVIEDYINSADLFILCWSENASKSEYVQKERLQALQRAFPQVQSQQDAPLSIYPLNIEPRAELPHDMKEYYHFGNMCSTLP